MSLYKLLAIFLLLGVAFGQTTWNRSGAGSTTYYHVGQEVGTVTPNNLTFPAVTVGSAATNQTAQLTNIGDLTITISSIDIRASLNAADFGVSSNCGGTLAAGAFCTLTFTLTPSVVGIETAVAEVISDAPGSPYLINLSGEGISAGAPNAVLTTNLNFPDTTVGNNSSLSGTLQNTGSATLNISSITVSGTNSADFSQGGTCGSTLAASASCSISVTFAPAAAGARTAQINVSDNAPGSPQVMTLAGNGLAANPLLINVAAIPNAFQGIGYSSTITAQGGTPPYAFSLNSGSFPVGLSINSGGAITGTANILSGPFSPQVKVTDNLGATATQTYSISVVTCGDFTNVDGYVGCSLGSDGTAVLPTTFVNTNPSATPSPGIVRTVTAGSYTSLVSTIAAAQCGDIVVIPSANTYTGTTITPAKTCDAAHWITIESDQMANLPAYGTRVSPCYANVASLTGRPSYGCPVGGAHDYMPHLVLNTGNNFFNLQTSTYMRLQGLDISVDCTQTSTNYFRLISAGDHQYFDRVWLHGCENAGAPAITTVPLQVQLGINFDGNDQALVNSYCNNFYATSAGSSVDADCANSGTGSNTQVGQKLVNNFMEASSESFIWGGGAGTVVPTDIEIRMNHFFKPLQWKCASGGCPAGGHYIIKNLGEFKNGARVLWEGNIADNTWTGGNAATLQGDQSGWAQLLTPKSQSGLCSVCEVRDVTIRYNLSRHTGNGLQAAAVLSDSGAASQGLHKWTAHDNVYEDVGPNNGQTPKGQCIENLVASADTFKDTDATYEHNDCFVTAGGGANTTIYFSGGSPVFTNWTIRANILPSTIFQSNPTLFNGVLTTLNNNLGTTWCVEGNIISTGNYSGEQVNNPWPQPTDQPSGGACPSGAHANLFPGIYTTIGFTNFNGGNGGDYHLTSGSVGHLAAFDGKDIGADIDALNAHIANSN